MRMLLKWEIGLEAGNAAIGCGRINELNRALFERAKPEAAYFCTENGTRTSYIFFDLADPAEIPCSPSRCSSSSTRKPSSSPS